MPLSMQQKKKKNLVWTFSAVQTGTKCATCRNWIASDEEKKKKEVIFKTLAPNSMFYLFLTKFKCQIEYSAPQSTCPAKSGIPGTLGLRASKACDCLCEMAPHGQLNSTSGWILQLAEFQQLFPWTPTTLRLLCFPFAIRTSHTLSHKML